MRKMVIILCLGWLVLCEGAFLSSLAAQDDYAGEIDDEEHGIKAKGVTYNMASDRRLEKIGGIYQPEDLDKYMKRRFDALDSQLGDLNNRIEGLEGTLKETRSLLENLSKDNEKNNISSELVR